MPTKSIEYLTALYFNNNITEIQKEELAILVIQLSDEQIRILLEKAWTNHVPDSNEQYDIPDELITSFFNQKVPLSHIQKIAPVVAMQRRFSYRRIATVAACILVLITGAYFWLQPVKNNTLVKKIVPQKKLLNDVAPGKQRALLILADGTQIVLDSASTGLLAQQGNAQIVKLPNGEILYNASGGKNAEILFNTMSTPAGGIYQLILPDGSKVWLNSTSSIRYPTEFADKVRLVEITGEAYFEIAKNADKPFIVKVNNLAEVKVTGTHFNVNAYDDEAVIKTTLLEGSVNISQGDNSSALVPGQQAQINKKGLIKRIDAADLEEAVAWKNGNFLFNSAGLSTVLRQAARWYDLEIIYEGKIPDDKFSGQISRSVNLSSLLKWMQWSEVHFKLAGKKLIINS